MSRIWYPRKELNLRLSFRKAVPYSLDDGDVNLVPSVGLKPTSRGSKPRILFIGRRGQWTIGAPGRGRTCIPALPMRSSAVELQGQVGEVGGLRSHVFRSAGGCLAGLGHNLNFWQERRDLNPQPAALETAALIQLSYAPAFDWRTRGESNPRQRIDNPLY